MNQQTDNMYIDDGYSDEVLRKREEIREHISWFREFLTFGTSLPEHIRRRYGLEEEYQRYKKLEIQVHRMPAEPDCRGYGKEQRMKELCEAGRAKGKITLAVEKAYESICPAPARDYLEEKYQELLYLRGMVYRKDYDDPMWYKPEILNKYGIDHKGPRETVLKQVEKAYRELDVRFCRMTGKKPDADELFGKPAVRQAVPAQKEAPENGARENRMCRRKGRRPGFCRKRKPGGLRLRKRRKEKRIEKNEGTKLKEDKKMNIKLTKTERLLLCGGLIGMASLMLQACDIMAKEDGDTRDRICGNWENAEAGPDILVYREGESYKVTLFRRKGVRRVLRPETYLLQREENGNLYMNTGFRIDVAYNEETDVLTFSPGGDYVRVNMDAGDGERTKEKENMQ